MYLLINLVLLNNTLTEENPTIQLLMPILYYIVLGIFGLYVLPILIYPLVYQRSSFVENVLFSSFSFLFFTPTYLNILNVYALCRIDDV